MLTRILNTVNRLGDASDAPDKEYSRKDLISWATGCMMGGLPDIFYQAWIEVSKEVEEGRNVVNAEYKCIINQGDNIDFFQPDDDLYPIQCIECLDDYLFEDKRNWKKCVLSFNPKIAEVRYEY